MGSLSLSFVSSTQLLLYPCSSAVKGRGCWLRSKEGKGRGEAEEGFDGIDESLSFLFLSSTKGARFSSLFEPSKHGTTPLGADAKGYPPLSLFIHLFVLFLSLFFSAFFAPLRWQIDAWFSHRCTSRTFLFLSYPFLPILYTPSSHVSTLLLENKNLVVFPFGI